MMEALQLIVSGQNEFPNPHYYFTLRLVSSLHNNTKNSETNFGENMKLR
jgi:hypothetical protein